MPIDQKTHDALTRVELRSLIYACDHCECDFECYCASNREWAEEKLRRLDAERTENADDCHDLSAIDSAKGK